MQKIPEAERNGGGWSDIEADKLPGIIMGTAVLEKNCLLMSWSY